MSTTELTITWILEKEFISTMLNMKWAKPFAFLEAKFFYNVMIKVLSSDEQKTNKEEEETN